MRLSSLSVIRNWMPTHVIFSNYLADRQATVTVAGFVPIFWRSPHNLIHATVDLGQMAEWISQQLHLEAEQCNPIYPPPGYEACSREGGGDKCRCKSQLRSHGHRLEQVSCRKGVIAGTVFDGHQEAGKASVSCWRLVKHV